MPEDNAAPENIMDLYLKLTKQYKQEYGEQTVLLMQVGSFFEIYGYYEKDSKELSPNTPIKEVSQICNLNIAEKKLIHNGCSIVMAGFRDYSLDKYIQKITDGEFTAIVYIQEKNGRDVIRKLHGIYSPGTYISYETDISPQITNNIMCIWFEVSKTISQNISYQQKLIYGVSVINIFTGESFIFEHECQFHMNPTTFDELERCISVFSPSEVLFISPFSQKDIQKVVQYSGIKTQMIHYISSDLSNTEIRASNEKIQNCLKQKYIIHILKTFFGEDAYHIYSEFTEYAVATQSLCYLLNFIQEHDANLVRKIHIPKFNNSSNRMVLANHTLAQLNIINDRDQNSKQYGQLSSVLSFLNKCLTPMGKRAFQFQLTNPTFDEDWLQREYDIISYFISQPDFDTIVGNIRRQLQGIKDMEKNCRQIVTKKLYPASLYYLYNSIDIIREINSGLYKYPEICDYLVENQRVADSSIEGGGSENNINKTAIETDEILGFLNHHFDIENCRGITSIQTFTENIILPGISKEIDDCIESLNRNRTAFFGIRDFLTTLLKQEIKMKEGDEFIKIHETEKSGKSLQITSKRATSLRTVLARFIQMRKDHGSETKVDIGGGFKMPLDDIKFSKYSSTSEEIHSALIKDINATIVKQEELLNRFITEVYSNLIQQLETKFFPQIENLCKYIAKLDILQSKAYMAVRNNYCCPVLDTGDKGSHIAFKEIRHVLIEHINQNELYVTNDLDLGDNLASNRGILLFGTNAVGKTSLIRAVGIAIIMAQSGMFVPCSEFRYKPYRSIFSRILSNDNLFKGLSTFAVEMSELRVILKMSDQYSLILGDELASGTETDSALSIFAAALVELDRKQCTYMFATHFHEITDFEEIRLLTEDRSPDESKHIRTLGLKHLAVKYDREQDCLMYDRKLKDGQGERIYGLEVCLSLDLPKSTMDLAFEFRNKYFSKMGGGELSQKTSRYNSKKIRGLCEICKTEKGTEIHHLLPQCDANDKGFIGAVFKNAVSNLASICEKCHREMHHSSSSPSTATKPQKKTNSESPQKGETVKMIRKKTSKGIVFVKDSPTFD